MSDHQIVVPKHVAIIMDGNGRWAKSKGLARNEGHRRGVESVREIVEVCQELQISYLSLYCFSTENWKRPKAEVAALMLLLGQFLDSEVSKLHKNGVRLRVIGERQNLSKGLQAKIDKAEMKTKENQGLTLVLCISYGGRDEIVAATKRFMHQALEADDTESFIQQLTPESFHNYLYLPEIPDPELVIRTSNEFRISNFLLWQSAYSEIVVTPVFWPEFRRTQLVDCLKQYSQRTRRFGMTDEQVSKS